MIKKNHGNIGEYDLWYKINYHFMSIKEKWVFFDARNEFVDRNHAFFRIIINPLLVLSLTTLVYLFISLYQEVFFTSPMHGYSLLDIWHLLHLSACILVLQGSIPIIQEPNQRVTNSVQQLNPIRIQSCQFVLRSPSVRSLPVSLVPVYMIQGNICTFFHLPSSVSWL